MGITKRAGKASRRDFEKKWLNRERAVKLKRSSISTTKRKKN